MTDTTRFAARSRLLHWLMAAMILTMLFVGASMVASLADYHLLLAIHRPLGIAVLAVALLRIVNRALTPPPPLPASMPRLQRLAAEASMVLLYVLMVAMPLVGWGMLSVARYPVVLCGALHLPPILPRDPALYAVLRRVHTGLAYLLFATIVGHFSAALAHALIFRDGVFESMASWRRGGDRAKR